MKHEEGFTVIEMLIFFTVLAILAIFFVIQKTDLDTSYADRDRKAAVNAIYYSLREVYFPAHGYYPEQIKVDTLSGIDQTILTDALGYTIGDPDSRYRYEGLDCDNQSKCRDFRLTADLDKEADYVKSSLE
ncbi:MAG: prepilin-type N-terminal cleavage/methylation domain-containing protein [Candidatus Nomurabacteria bacterium]|jgi:type II secretory pathway pseudopilin PulG|nr:prepilin-type N-terminal cleavage/methylation domain-containing protein [Candidatus Nomurabacteria bacterium]